MSKGHRRSLSEPKSAAALLEASRAELGIKALGVVCEVRLHRGGRQLTVKSDSEECRLLSSGAGCQRHLVE